MPYKINIKNGSNQDIYFQSKYPEWTFYNLTGGLSVPQPLSLPSDGWTELQIRVHYSNQHRYTIFVPKKFIDSYGGQTIIHPCGNGASNAWNYSGPRIWITITSSMLLNILASYTGDLDRSIIENTYVYVYLR